MNSEMFSFDVPAWELAFRNVSKGDSFSAIRLLTLLEGETEEEVEEAFAWLEENRVALDISQMPENFGSGETEDRLHREHMLVQSGGDILVELEDSDPLKLYLQEIAQIPTAGDPAVMMKAYLAGNEDALQALTNATISKAIDAAMAMTGKGVLLLDLIQEASLGLWQGILHYDSGNLDAHLQWWIDFYLAKACIMHDRSSGVGLKMRKALEEYRNTDHQLLADLGRNPTVEEIAVHMHITAEEAEVYDDMLRSARLMEQVKKTPQQDEQEEDQAVEDTAYFQSRQRILDMLSTLTEQQAKVLTMRYGLEGTAPMTAQETATKLNLTAAEVTKLEAEALQQLRKTET